MSRKSKPHSLLGAIMLVISIISAQSCNSEKESFWTVQDGNIVKDGRTEYFIGTNLWYAGRLCATQEGRDRLEKELQILKGIGVNNLRVLAVEGEDQDNLAYALDRMQEYGMGAVLFLNNCWEWSYGFPNYLEAAGAGDQPRPGPGTYQAYMNAMAAFSTNDKAIAISQDYIRTIVPRFKNHPAIFSWQICNEPRCFSADPEVRSSFVKYIHSTAELIKSLDPNHMVSTGNEGFMGCEQDMALCEQVNDCPYVDYITIHIWPYNWSWVSSDSVNDGVEAAVEKVNEYIDRHIELAGKLDKPVVIEEFGYPRDGFVFTPGSATCGRDRIYDCVFSRVVESAADKGRLAGCNFWGWGGEARPVHTTWVEGDEFCGDPSQEPQGLNSVFSCDESTIALISRAAADIRGLQESRVITGAAKALYDTLKKAAEEETPLFGHQDDLMYGHLEWNVSRENDHSMERSDVFAVAGKYPAVLGLDLGGIERDDSCNLDGNNFELMREAALKHYERGGIVSFSWHLRNPLTGGDAWDISSDKVVGSILPGGEKHEYFLGWLDKLAAYLSSLKDGDGNVIPVIFRPWHEHTGSWFWWGKNLCTPEQYNGLWIMTYDYLVKEKGLDNMLWAISPGTEQEFFEARYPGDRVVDIIGLDCYCHPTAADNAGDFSDYVAKVRDHLTWRNDFAVRHGKILALTETGCESLPYEKWWTEVLAPAIEGIPVSYVLVWRNADIRPLGLKHFYAPWPGGPSEKDFVKWIEGGKVGMLD
ncbi:MAG: cellulase family glycosylhydrolase [Bacteroidales bacterium]|nr:cellulase family glycosylhydrolase [Bacteroidales bacterium]